MENKLQINDSKKNTYLLMFERDDKTLYFDLKDGKWQAWGDLPIDESAKLLFDNLGGLIDERIKQLNK